MNAKELILKKINADTNWVDIYTSAFVLGEDLNTIGSFMISPEISELISKYSSSLFDPDASFETKIQFIEKNISEANTPAKKYAYTELLERVKIAEELRILGKILKINQGMPTNTADFYEYISKIEYYIESRLNKQLIDKYNGVRNLTSEEWIGRKKYYDTTVFPYKNAFKLLKSAIKKYGYPYEIEDLLNSDKTELTPELEKAVTTFEDTMRSLGYIGHSYWKDYKVVQEAYSEWYEDLGKVINELKENWKKFSIVRFVKDNDYAQITISEYESTKVKFNILDVLKSLPHFNEMYKVLALNDRVLTVLSKRNEIESKVWQKAIHKYSNGNADILMTTPNKSERKILKSLVDDALIQTWLTTGLTDFYLSSPDGTRLDFDGSLNISKLKSFIETSIIPRLRNNKFIINGQNIDTKSNEFVRRLTFGKHNGESIFKLPFNMSEIDSNPGIKQEYEKILQAFGELRNIHLEGGLTIVDVFYLYNLIVHKDHFGRNSLTRLFEDLISSKDGEKLLVFKFNEWLETVNEQEIVGKVLSSWGASHRNDLSLTGNSTQIYISINPLNKSIPFYSGGANGSDSAWGLYLRQQGFTVKDYTVDDWRALSAEQKGYYEQLYQAAINLMGIEGWPADSYAGELTRRDMMQADSATSIFAIGTLSNSGKVNGGTKYATYAAISQGKPVYLFNLNNNSWYWYDYNSSSFIRMNDKPNLISGAAVIGTRDDKSKTGAEALRASGHEAIKDIIDRSLKLSVPKTRTVKYTPKGQAEQTLTIIGTKIFNKDGDEVYADENSGHRKLIFVELALQEKRAVKVEYRNVTYVVNDRNQIFSTSSNKIVYQNENDGNRRVILEKAKEEFAKLQNIAKSIDINTISTKTESFGVVFPKQGKTSQALKSEYQQWQTDNSTGIVAFRVKFPYNTVEEVQLGHIGNPFSENARGANTVQQFYDWLVTGNNFGNEKATDEYRRAIISKLLSTPANSPILYYTELNRPSHATVLGYLIANKQLLSNQSSPRVEIYQGYWTRKEVESQTDKIFLFGDNTDDRVNTHYVPTRTQAVIRGLPNAIGIDTKKNRGISESSYFTDVDFDIFKAQVDEAIQRAIDSGKTIVIPADGIGTGKAELDKRAPKLFAYLQQRLDELKKLNSTSPVQFDDPIDISEESVVEEPVTIGFNNTSDRVLEEPDESTYTEPIRRLQLLDDYYRPIFTSEELISFEEDAKRIFNNESILNERINIHYSEWKILDDITDMRRWEKIWEDIVYDGNAEESENDFKYNNKSKTVQIPKYIYDRIKLYQKYQKLVDFLMGIAQKNNYYDYYGNLLRHDEDWFGDLEGTSLNILEDLYDLAGIKEIYDDPNQLELFDSLHIDSDYIAEREEILRNAPRNSEGQLLAPNGKVSKLTEEQWVTVRTKAFKEWFGDWINPYNTSIQIGLDIDIESADASGFGSMAVIILTDKDNPLQGEAIGTIPMYQQIKSINDFKFTKYIDINSVGGSSYIEEGFRGKGFGKAAYWELGMWLSRNGSILRSAKDNSRTEAATRVWKSLERDGFAKKVGDRYEFVNNTSKVIDENGEPLVVYHHTDNPNLTEFSTDFDNYFSQSKGGTKKAIFFDENPSGTLDRKYDIPVFLNIRNLTTYVGTKEDLHRKGTDYTAVVNESAKRDARYGGLHMSKFDDNRLLDQDVWIIHDANNVKSAISAHKFTSSPNIYDADPTPVYQTTPSKQSKLIEVIRQASEKGIKGLHIVSQSDLINEDIYIRSAKGFVRNGEIYINVDRAGDDTVIHEFGHLYLADAKVNNREKYYELLEKVRQTKLWSDMKTWKAYANKIGSDFDEEVLATMIGDYYKSEFGTDYEYTDLVNEALSLVDGGFIDLINSEILPDLGDTFITNYALSQKTATLKHKLVSDNILKENCL